jgi:hypothetical protein
MYLQLFIEKNGLAAGASKTTCPRMSNLLWANLISQIQRAACHIGKVTSTIYETGLSNFADDVPSLLWHGFD